MWSADLALLPFLCEDVTDQRLLKNFLFDQEMPQTSGWKGLVVLCPGRQKKKNADRNEVIFNPAVRPAGTRARNKDDRLKIHYFAFTSGCAYTNI